MNKELILVVVPDLQAPLNPALAAQLAGQQFETELAHPHGVSRVIEGLIGQGREPSAVLVGPGVDQAAAVARAIRSTYPVGQILFVPSEAQFAAVKNALRYVPSLGPNWSLVQLGDPRLGERIARAVQAGRQRARLRTTLDRANLRLATPKAVDSVAYRQSVISEHYLASLLQHSSDAIFSLDPQNNVLYWSTGAEHLFHFHPRHHQHAAELPFWSATLDLLLERIQAGESPLKTELTAVVDGRTLHLEVSMARVQDENRRFIGTSVAVRDVSDAVRAIEVERAARQHAERLSRLKDEFLALLSHELRTPLSAVIGHTQLLRMQYGESSPLQFSLEIIERNAKLQAKLIEDLLDVSAIITGKLTVERQPLEMVSLLSSAIDSVRSLADAKQQRLTTFFPVEGVTIAGDAHRLQQVFYNILSNAIKFTPEGGEVRVRAALDADRRVRIQVEDSGCGIAAEFLPHVFEKFGQEDASITRTHGGLGLGLSIAKQLTELHDGTIDVASPGRGLGTTFTLSFPVCTADQEAVHSEQVPAARPLSLAQRCILVVEDFADTRELVREVLSAHGARVLTADSAQGALHLLEQPGAAVPDALVSDIGMPGMDGYQLIGEVRRRGFSPHALPAVALTAYASPADRQRALDAGFQAHVAKPHIVTALVFALAEVLAADGQPSG